MKRISTLIALAVFLTTFSCNSPTATSTDKPADSSVVPPPSSNSDATNSSVADTAYPKKDSIAGKTDSLPKK